VIVIPESREAQRSGLIRDLQHPSGAKEIPALRASRFGRDDNLFEPLT
jgi:hypothetical protein